MNHRVSTRDTLQPNQTLTPTITGFLTLDVAERDARTGRNPRTGEPLEIAARTVVRVSAGQALKRAVAGN